jgi:hypothetical protein
VSAKWHNNAERYNGKETKNIEHIWDGQPDLTPTISQRNLTIDSPPKGDELQREDRRDKGTGLY